MVWGQTEDWGRQLWASFGILEEGESDNQFHSLSEFSLYGRRVLAAGERAGSTACTPKLCPFGDYRDKQYEGNRKSVLKTGEGLL